MGRRNASSTSSTQAPASAEVTTENQENDMTTVTDENTETVAEATDENTDSTVTESPEDMETAAAEAAENEAKSAAAMQAFETVVASAVEARDTSTGVVPEVNISEVNAAYRELDGVKAKTTAKKLVGKGMQDALNNMDLTTARAYMNLQEKLSAAGGGTKTATERPPADPTEALAQQYAVLSLAHSNVQVPEGIDPAKLNELIEKLLADAGTKVAEYITYLTTETPEGDEEPTEPTVEGYIKNAAKLALGRSAKAGATKAKSTSTGGVGSSYAGPRRDVAKHIQEAFADKASGAFLTIAQIADFKSSEYTDGAGNFDKPSQGAISARLFPSGEGKKCTVEGVTPDTQDGKKGAKKA